MKPGDGPQNLGTKPIPEVIRQLWELYFVMSLDPVLAGCADHIRQAALMLEHRRQLAFQVSRDASREHSRQAKRRRQRPEEAAQAPVEDASIAWLRTAKAGSLLKH